MKLKNTTMKMMTAKKLMVKKLTLASILLSLGATGLAFADQRGPLNQIDHWGSRYPTMGLAKTARDAAFKYQDIQLAMDDGYIKVTACVNGPDVGAQGIHYLNPGLIGDGALDPETPEVLLYEPTRDGNMRLVAVEYLTDKVAWHKTNGDGVAPEVGGQQMFLLEYPNRFAVPDTYILRVWAFKRNIAGMFALNNPNVSCEFYEPE